MKNFITALLKSVIQVLFSSYLCYIIYNWNNLGLLFNLKLEYNHWVAILVIIQTLIPINNLTSLIIKKDDN